MLLFRLSAFPRPRRSACHHTGPGTALHKSGMAPKLRSAACADAALTSRRFSPAWPVMKRVRFRRRAFRAAASVDGAYQAACTIAWPHHPRSTIVHSAALDGAACITGISDPPPPIASSPAPLRTASRYAGPFPASPAGARGGFASIDSRFALVLSRHTAYTVTACSIHCRTCSYDPQQAACTVAACTVAAYSAALSRLHMHAAASAESELTLPRTTTTTFSSSTSCCCSCCCCFCCGGGGGAAGSGGGDPLGDLAALEVTGLRLHEVTGLRLHEVTGLRLHEATGLRLRRTPGGVQAEGAECH